LPRLDGVQDRRAFDQCGGRLLLDPVANLGRARQRNCLLDRHGHLTCRVETASPIGSERPHHDGFQLGWHVRDDARRSLDLAVDDAINRHGVIVPNEAPLARDKLPEHDASRVDVRPPVHGFATHLLDGHIGELALDLSVPRRLHPIARLGDTEVAYPGQPVGPNENVLRRHVPMDQSEQRTRFRGYLVRSM
jgi:hypothetical protein